MKNLKNQMIENGIRWIREEAIARDIGYKEAYSLWNIRALEAARDSGNREELAVRDAVLDELEDEEHEQFQIDDIRSRHGQVI
jgi:hypothetical protein|tara:strand:+ start:106 stop:354 length:249 start_codon:yes stop_codon:yes gene_type:complete